MSNFDDTLARIKALCTYGMTNEDKHINTSTLEYTKKAADGKYYGIVKECNHYYIKQTSEGKEKLAESYDYIGGFMNKKNYQYDSYNNALKNLELKLSSINEAQNGRVNVQTLDPFKKEDLVIEGTEKMRDEIARQRQIMYNASMLMNESIGFANVGTPEAPKGSNDEDKPFTDTAKATGDKDPKENAENPEKQGEPFGDGKAPEKGKDVKDGDVYSDGKAVAAQHPSGGKVTRVNEGCCDTDFDEGLGKGEEPANIGWDVEGQEKVNEDCCDTDLDAGVPSYPQAGIGSPDGHLMEDDEDDVYLDDEEDEPEILDDEEVEDTDTFEDEESEEEPEGEEEIVDDEEEVVDEPAEDAELGDEEEIEEFDENDPEALRLEIERLQEKLAELEGEEAEAEPMEEPAEEPIADEPSEEPTEEPEVGAEADIEELPEDFEDEDEFKFEAKNRKLNRIIESVVKDILKEDELHVFGDHPGYRKKPMTLPPTGQDKNEHGEDINDDSVHNEEPFGKQIGDSSPYNQLVNAVAKDVMYQLKHGAPLDNKKKVN